MPDWRAFARKHVVTARRAGLRTAAARAGAEAAQWLHARWVAADGRLIWDADWDVCLILDACRYDLWRNVALAYPWLPTTGSAWSVGSASPEWYGATFDPAVLPDERVGLVTANPFAGKLGDRMPRWLGEATPADRHLTYCDYVYDDCWGVETEQGYLDVTPPAAVTDRAIPAWRDRDLDRLVVHYMQPHLPFRAHPEWFGVRADLDRFGETSTDLYDSDGKEIWKELRDGDREFGAVWSAYKDNLQWVFEEVARWRETVDATLLVTSDHGNGLGEWGIWSHPPGVQVPALRRVPWVTLDASRDRAFEPRVTASSSAPTPTVDEQLAALGYQ